MDTFVFQDESGEPGKDPFFFSGAITIPEPELRKLNALLARIREEERFNDEFHFQKVSGWRERVYRRVFDEVLNDINFHFKVIVVRRERLEMSYFSHQKHLAYNRFTFLNILHSLRSRANGGVYIYVDDRCRVRRDNFLSYLKQELNWKALEKGLSYEVRAVEPRTSLTEEALQVCDLFIGATKQLYVPATGDRKKTLSQFFDRHPERRRKVDMWDWQPYPR
ncbi:MAG: DUF3800 domain-containing protein [Bacillota bacterium]